MNQGTLFLGDPSQAFSNPRTFLGGTSVSRNELQRRFGDAEGGYDSMTIAARHRFGIAQRHARPT